jgi:hypothetical protein
MVAAMAQIRVFFFVVAVRFLDVFGHVFRGDADQRIVSEVFQRFFEQDPSVAAVVARDPGIVQQQIGVSADVLENDTVHFARFEIFDNLAAALEDILPKGDFSVLVDQGKPFGFAEQGSDGALYSVGFYGYSNH